MRCLQDRVEALPGRARNELQLLAAGHVSIHREPVAVEVVARRVEDDEVEARGRAVAYTVALRVRAPEERVVERVEVGTLRNRRAFRVERPVRAPDVVLEPRGRLERRAVPD